MGLMVSVLVFCVGVVEALDCWHHFMFHLVTPPRNILPYRVDPQSDILCETEDHSNVPEVRRLSHVDICWPKDLSPTDDLHVIKKRSHNESERKHEHDKDRHASEEKDVDHHRHTTKLEVHTPDLAELVDSPLPSREHSPSHVELGVIIESDSSSDLDEPSEIENLSYKDKSSSLSAVNQNDLGKPEEDSTNVVLEAAGDLNSENVRTKSPSVENIERSNITLEEDSQNESIEDDTKLPQFTDALLSGNVKKIPHRYPLENQNNPQECFLDRSKEENLSKDILSMSSIDSDKFDDAVEPTSLELQRIEEGLNVNDPSGISHSSSFPEIKLHESSPVSMEESSDSSVNTSDASMMARSRTSDRPLIVRFAPSQDDVARDFMSVAQTGMQTSCSKESSLESEKSETNLSSIKSSSKITLDSAYPADDSSEVKSISIEGINSRQVPSDGNENEEQKATGQPETNSSSSSLSGIPQLPEDARENNAIVPIPTDNGFDRVKLSTDSLEDEYLSKVSLNISSEDGNDTTGLLNVSSSDLATSKDGSENLRTDENNTSFVLESGTEEPPPSIDKIEEKEENVELKIEPLSIKETPINDTLDTPRNVKSGNDVLLGEDNIKDDSKFEASTIEAQSLVSWQEKSSEPQPKNFDSNQEHREICSEINQYENTNVSTVEGSTKLSTDGEKSLQALKDEQDISNDIDLETECRPQAIQRRFKKRKSSLSSSRQSSIENKPAVDDSEMTVSQEETSDKLEDSNKPTQRRDTKLKSSSNMSRQSSSDSTILEHGAYEYGSLEGERFDDVKIDSDAELKKIPRRDSKRKSSLRNSRQSSSEVILQNVDPVFDQPSPKVLKEKLENILHQSSAGGEQLTDATKNPDTTNVPDTKLTESESQSHPLQRRNTKRKSSLKGSRQPSSEDQTPPNTSGGIPTTAIPDNNIAVENELSELSQEVDIPKPKVKTKQSAKLYSKSDTPVICKAKESDEVKSSNELVGSESVRTSDTVGAPSVGSNPEQKQSSAASPSEVQGDANVPTSSKEKNDQSSKLIFSGEYTKAMNKDWHSGHFCCWQCDESLTGQRYVLRDEHPYCIKCYESVFANGCEECNKTIGIDSKDLSYKDKHWHEACFLCNKCRVSLVDKQFGSKLDKIFCGNCYDAQFASRCDGCGQIFKAGTKKMEYKTRQWHEPCFACCVCKTAIGTKSFIPREQEIYCATCYEEKFATRCVKCNKIITSGGVTYKNEPWHRECFTCTNCSTSLAGQRFTSRDEKPYCADCFGELFAKRCTACCKPITGIGGTRFISFEDRHWHNDCFICASCKTSLVGRGFITDAEDIICPECAKQKLM